jgi:2-polyprenyl-3-methyl-5-hydroxy-6-metoxy-1,4-benzoquinol methylase
MDPKKLVTYKSRDNCELRECNVTNCRQKWINVLKLKDHESSLGEFNVVYCENCKLGFTDPYPTEETSGYLYSTKASSDFDIIKDTIIDKLKDFLSKRFLKNITSGKNVLKVLDYATGNGRFAISASRAFPNAIIDAVDYQETPPPLLSNDYKKRYNLENKVSYFSLDKFSYNNKSYDLIILRHVLEHTHHPIELVKQLSYMLAADAMLYIEVPNLDSGCGFLIGKNWKGYYVPRHIFHYTKSSLKEIINIAGMNANIGFNEMPLMGNTISILLNISKTNLFVQLAGVLLHPVQLLIGFISGNPTCINAKCTKKK